MSYLALYRRFRPVDFDGVIGQDAIVKTLTNQIKSDKIGHAYLFCGTRGTGKTTLAKIFARAVNCISPINGSPCGKCEACKSLLDSSQIDVVEMDAASNNRVENVRDIRDSVQYPPVKVRYKVYIIDEVHMLTSEAFNALLKTLEEPPKHAIFILATTEPHKIPATILSRCMRFDFKLVSTSEIAKLISGIYDEIGKKYTKEAIMAIAKAGEGSVRDALSVADLCVSVGDGELKYQDVSNVLGATDISKTNELIANVFAGNVGGVLAITEELSSLGKSIGVLVKDIIGYLRDIFIVKTCKNSKEILALPEDTYEMELKTAKLASEHRILRVLEIISSIENSLRFSTQPRSILETALIKASMPEIDYNIDALISRIDSLEKELGEIKKAGVKVIEKTVTVEKPVIVEKPVVEKVVAEEKPVKKSVQEDDDFYSFIPEPPPVEEDYEIIGLPVTPKKAEVIEPKKVEVEPKQPQKIDVQKFEEVKDVIVDNAFSKPVSSPKPNADGKRVWGTVVRKLRTMPGKTILWVACQEMQAELVGNELCLIVDGESEKNLLNKDGNLDVIQSLVSEMSPYSVVIKEKSKVTSSVPVEDQLKAFFGDTFKTKQ